MKAQMNIALIMAVSVLTVVGVFSFSLAYQTESVVKGFRERSIIHSINEMEFFKKAVEQSFTYSAYQGIYDLAKNGGFTENNGHTARWIYYGKLESPLPKEKAGLDSFVQDKVSASTAIIHKEYLDKIKVPGLTLPEYAVDSKIDSGMIDVNAESEGSLGFDSPDLKISTQLPLESKVKSKMKKVFDTAYDKFGTNDEIGNGIVQAASDQPAACTIRKERVVCDTGNFNPEKAFGPNDESGCMRDFEAKILSGIDSLRPSSDNDVQVSIDTRFLENKWYFSGACTNTGASDRDDDCCKRKDFGQCPTGYSENGATCERPIQTCTEKLVPNPNYPGETEEFIIEKTCVDDIEVIGRPLVCVDWYTAYYNVECHYDYFARVKSDVSIKDTSVKYPVYDSSEQKSGFRNNNLLFSIETGNKCPNGQFQLGC